MNREALRDRLTKDRSAKLETNEMVPHPRGNGEGPHGRLWGTVSGKKLTEAASYLQSARAALLCWTRETCAHADNLETHADHLEGLCKALEAHRDTVAFKARLYGETP
jgi:hypothetical protein